MVSRERIREVAAGFEILADPTRLEILLGLADGEGTLADVLGDDYRAHVRGIHHAGILVARGMVARRWRGRGWRYRLTPAGRVLLERAQLAMAD